jgi:hypothetical protein
MNRNLALTLVLCLPACGSGGSNPPPTQEDGSANDGTMPTDSAGGDSSAPDTNSASPEAATSDVAATSSDVATPSDASDAGTTSVPADGATAPDGSDAASDAAALSDAACPTSWTVAPETVPLIAVPDGGGGVLLHATGAGTQDYTCTATAADAGADGGDSGLAYAWVFVGPEAVLSDCNTAPIGHHFASEAGASQPEWMTTSDDSYVIAKKVNAGYTPDGGTAIPWLLLQALSNSDGGTLGQVTYVQRLNTTAGLTPPNSSCDETTVGTTQKVGYTADYYFFGP